MFFTVLIDILLFFVQLRQENFVKIVRHPPFYDLSESTLVDSFIFNFNHEYIPQACVVFFAIFETLMS